MPTLMTMYVHSEEDCLHVSRHGEKKDVQEMESLCAVTVI